MVSIPLPLPKQGEIAREAAMTCRSATSFNPLPLPKQGEISTYSRLSKVATCFQSRSPCRSKGRFVIKHMWDRADLFQSAPLAEARGRCPTMSRRSSPLRCRFNPLPLPKQGEIMYLCSPHQSSGQFQSAPPFAEARGDRRSRGLPRLERWSFNPLPLPKQGEDRKRRAHGRRRIEFQSAPLAEARGDTPPLLSRAAT